MTPRPNTSDHLKMDAVTQPATATVVENPYLIVLAKKTRSLKKKLQRIARAEEARAAGKPINGEQLKLLESKSAVEVALTEHDRVRSTIEEVDRELKSKAIAEAINAPPASAVAEATNAPPASAVAEAMNAPPASAVTEAMNAPPASAVTEAMNAPPASAVSLTPSDPQTDPMVTPLADPYVPAPASSGEADIESGSDGPAKQPDMDSTGLIAEEETPRKPPRLKSLVVATDPCPTEHASVQTDLSGPPPPPGLDPTQVANEAATAALIAAQEQEKALTVAESRGLAAGRAEMTTGLTKIFSLLHAAVRCQAKGEPLPSPVDFFSKVLVGKTILPDEADFDGCVAYSVERARLFVDPAYSSQEVAPGTTIKKLEDVVSSIREEIMNGPAAPEEPVFNFFADSCPAEPSGDGNVAASGTSSPNETFVSQPPPPTLMAENHHENARLQTQPPAPTNVHGKEDVGHQVQPPPPTLTTERENEHQPLPPPPLSPQMTKGDKGEAEHKTPPRQVLVPPHNGQQHSMVLLLPRPPVSPQHSVKTISPSSPSPRHATGQDAGKRSHESGFLARQASEMEEGVLPPVVRQEHPRPPPLAVVKGHLALPKRERRQIFCSRGSPPPPPFSPPFFPGPSGGGGGYMISQPRNLSPTTLRQQQGRPPFVYQHPSPCRTQLQAGQGFVPQAPSPSPPAPGTPQSLPPEGSTNGGYANGWGYQPHAPQEALFVQNQWYQHKPYGRPMHPAPMHVHSEPVAGAPWGRGGVTLSPSNQYSPGVSPFRAVNGPPRHTRGEISLHFSNGLTVTSDRADTDRDSPAVVETETELPPIPTDSGPLGQPSGFTPAAEHTPPSVQPPPEAPPTSSLAQEVASPPQERPREAEVGSRPAIIDAARDSVALGSSLDGEHALGAESASERGRGLVDHDHHPQAQHALSNGVVPSLGEVVPSPEGLVDHDHHPQEQHARSNGVVPSSAEVVPSPETSGAPASSAKSAVSDTLMACTNGQVPAGSTEASGEGSAGKPRAGGKGRASHSRARAGRRAESRVTSSKDGENGDVPPQPKPVTKDGRGQRRSRDQRRGQPLQKQEEYQAPSTAHDQAAHTPPEPPEGRGASRCQHESAKSMVSTPLAVPPTVKLQPKASSRTPVSLSWADEIPSPRAQPAQQQRRRGNGGGRNRQTSQQISLEKQGQPRANGGLNNRSLGVASQGPSNRKGRASSHRGKGGGNGNNGNGNGGGGVQHSL